LKVDYTINPKSKIFLTSLSWSSMSALIIDGKSIAETHKAQTSAGIKRLRGLGHNVRLTAVIVGATPAAELYAHRQAEGCRAIGIDYDLLALPDDISNRDLRHEIRALNQNQSITGIMLHLPMPAHIDTARIQYEIDVVKDVEGVNPANIGYVLYRHVVIAPCTALAAVELVKHSGVQMEGAECVVVGASHIVGKPIALLMVEQMATVTLCHIATRDLKLHTTRADILIVAAGKAGLITATHVRPGACVIDVGINRVTTPDGVHKTVGDVDFTSVKEIAGHISPVPGGVGPMTVAMLLRNTLRSAEIIAGVVQG
jgi:methylenetetrahydrofolate dehydrogenase (NADP+) / methenyltetrahydrofolate cyclohydrolase